MRLGDCGKTNLHTYSDKEKWSVDCKMKLDT